MFGVAFDVPFDVYPIGVLAADVRMAITIGSFGLLRGTAAETRPICYRP